MKNTVCVNKLQHCSYCKIKGFFCYTPSDADFETCPCCGYDDFLNDIVNYKDAPTKYNFLFEDGYENDKRNVYRYCDFCKIIFELGCMHYNGGCTSNVYNCHFIKKWKDKITNIEYEGMPIFDDKDDWFDNVNNIEVLQMYCPHKGDKCKQTTYQVKEICNL